jgi:GTPase SAR1 family protein
VVLAVFLAVFIVMRRKSHHRKQAQKYFPNDLAPAYEEHPPKDAMVEVPGSTMHALEMPIGKEHNSHYVQELPGGGNEKTGKVQPVELQ